MDKSQQTPLSEGDTRKITAGGDLDMKLSGDVSVAKFQGEDKDQVANSLDPIKPAGPTKISGTSSTTN